MISININETEYKIKYSYNAFADTDLLDRVQNISLLLDSADVENDEDVSALGKIKDLFVLTRELFFVGLEKFNPAVDIKEAGDLLDDYHDEAPEGESRGLLDIFTMLANELTDEGFLADLMTPAPQNIKSMPQDHKRSTKKAKASAN